MNSPGVVLQLLVIGIIKAFQFGNVIYFYLSVLQEVSVLSLCGESGSCHDLCLLSPSLPPSVSLFEMVVSQPDPHTPPAVLLAECVSLGMITIKYHQLEASATKTSWFSIHKPR